MGRSQTASWADYDGDGRLDLYVANWNCESCVDPPGPLGSQDALFHQEADGRFTNVTTELLGTHEPLGYAYASVWLDYDDDRDPDLLVMADKGYDDPPREDSYWNRNVLWRNDGAGCGGWCFTDVSVETGADQHTDAMGVAVADYDNDLDLDYFYTDVRAQQLLRNNGGTFELVGEAAGVSYPRTGWGTAFLDYDNDGWLDLYVAIDQNGDEGNRLFRNDALGEFEDVSRQSCASHVSNTYGVSYADYDGDGALDIAIGNRPDVVTNRLFRNLEGDNGNHWIRFRLTGGGPVNRDAVGARVYLRRSDGLEQMQEVKNGSSMGSGNDLALHFGLGDATLTEARVVWPDGREQSLGAPDRDREWAVSYSD